MVIEEFSAAKKEVTYPLPVLITFAGVSVAVAVQDVLKRRAATNPKRKGPPLMLNTLRGFANTLHKYGLFDLALVSTGDVDAYLSTLSRSTRHSFSSLLRALFEELAEKKLIDKSPFTRHYNSGFGRASLRLEGEDRVRDALEMRAPWALYFARKSSAACEQALVEFVGKHRRPDSTKGYRLAELENVAKWMVAEGVESWAKVTEEHMGRYRTICLRDQPDAVRNGYTYFAALFLRYLFRKGLVPAKFKSFFKAWQRIVPKPIYLGDAVALMQRFRSLKEPPELAQDFTLWKMDEMPFHVRSLIARLVVNMDIAFNGAAIRVHGPYGDMRKEGMQYLSAKEIKLGMQLRVIEMEQTGPRFTPRFITRYNLPSRELQAWAKGFEPKMLTNIKLTKIAPPLPPKGYRAHKATLARAATTVESGP